jgi:hypothetical protein
MSNGISDPRNELREIAKRTHSRVRELNVSVPGTKPAFDEVCRFTRDGFQIDWATNGRVFRIEVKAETGVVMSAGRPAPFMLATKQLDAIGGVEIFAGDHFSPERWLQESRLRSALTRLDLRLGEHLLVARNSTALTVEPRGVAEDWNRLSDLLGLVSELPPDEPVGAGGELIDGLRFDSAIVPPALQNSPRCCVNGLARMMTSVVC